MPTVVLNSAGFSVDHGTRRDIVEWTRVREMIAFKLDLVTHDTIRIAFNLDDGGCVEVDEDWTGYTDFLPLIETHFGLAKDWWSGVARPAFATNRTVLWTVGQDSPPNC